MPFKIDTMIETVKFHVAKFHAGSVTEKELKQQLFQRAMQEARSARGCCGQVFYVQLVELLYQFIEGLYYQLNHPVVDVAFYRNMLGVKNSGDIADKFQESLDILKTSFVYNRFSRRYVYLLGMAKASCIEYKGESLEFVANLFKLYFQAFSQVMETFCDGS